MALLVLVLAAGLAGNQNPTRNLAPTAIWIVWWVGVAYVSALIGNVCFTETEDSPLTAGADGGILRPEREGPWPGNMTLYIAVEDLAPYRKSIIAAGGKIHVEEQEVPGMGSFSLFTDPEGRMMGLWKSVKR